MAQITLRVSDAEAAEFKAAAARAGQSLNEWAGFALRVRVDPDLAGDEADRVRERLRRAGLLAQTPPREGRRPDPKRVAAARREAGKGTPLSESVAEQRGPR
ncbi:MAG: transcriptional regulator [Dehalococcoidia bacterium]